MIKLIIEADLSSEELQVLISEVTILHRDVFKKPLVLQQTDVSGALPGSDEDLAAEIIARYWQNNGRQGRITKMMKEAFVDGAIWMKGRLSGNDR